MLLLLLLVGGVSRGLLGGLSPEMSHLQIQRQAGHLLRSSPSLRFHEALQQPDQASSRVVSLAHKVVGGWVNAGGLGKRYVV